MATDKRVRVGRARGHLAAAATVLVIIGIAVVLWRAYTARLRSDLETQYRAAAVHLARLVEDEFRVFGSVAKHVDFSPAQSISPSRAKELEATGRLQGAKAVHDATVAAHDAANRRIDSAKSLLAEVATTRAEVQKELDRQGERSDEQKKRLAEVLRALEYAEEKSDRATDEADSAREKAETAKARAEALRKAAEMEAEQQRRATDDPTQRPSSEQGVAQSAPPKPLVVPVAGTGGSSDGTPSTDMGVSAAQAAAAAASRAAEDAQKTASEARLMAENAQAEADRSLRAAKEIWSEFQMQEARASAAKSAVDEAEARHAETASLVKEAESRQEQVAAQRRWDELEFQRALRLANSTKDDVARLVGQALETLVPSYEGRIMECLSAEGLGAQRCMWKAIAEMKGVKEYPLALCPGGSDVPAGQTFFGQNRTYAYYAFGSSVPAKSSASASALPDAPGPSPSPPAGLGSDRGSAAQDRDPGATAPKATTGKNTASGDPRTAATPGPAAPSSPVTPSSPATPSGPAAPGTPSVCASLHLPSALGSALRSDAKDVFHRPLRQFDDVLLFDRSGRALDSESSSGLRVASFDVIDPERTFTSQVIADRTIAGTKYTAFVQPVSSSVLSDATASPTSSGLVLVGLVADSRLQSDSDSVDPMVFLWATLFVGLTVLTIPMAKLWLLGKRSRYTRFDLALLTTAAAATTLFATLCVWAQFAHDGLEQRLDDRLEYASDNIDTGISSHVSQAGAWLSELMKTVETLDLIPATDDERAKFSEQCRSIGGTFKMLPIRNANGAEETDKRPFCEKVNHDARANTEHTGWNLFAVMDRDGYQVAKLAPDPFSTTPIRVRQREYFRRALGGDTRLLPAGGESHWSAHEVVRSINTGRRLLVVARPVGGSDGSPPEGVAAVYVPLPSLDNIALPEGFRFAVVDEQGKVMLHSDDANQHSYDFFRDLSEPADLRALMAAGAPDHLDLRYLGTSTRSYVRQLGKTDWFLLTMAPSSLVDIPASHMLILSAIGTLGFLAVLLAVTCALLLARGLLWDSGPGHDAVGLRPTPDRETRYLAVGTVTILCGVLLCLFSGLLPNVPLALVLLLLAGTVVFGTFMGVRSDGLAWLDASFHRWCSVVRRGRRPFAGGHAGAMTAAHQRPGAQLTRNYTVWAFGVVVATIIAPATVFFQASYAHVVENVVRTEQQHWARTAQRVLPCQLPIIQQLGDSSQAEATPTEGSHPVQGKNDRCFPIADTPSLADRTGPTGGVAAVMKSALGNPLFWPVPRLMDALPPMGPASREGGKLYRSNQERELNSTRLTEKLQRGTLVLNTKHPRLFSDNQELLSALIVVFAFITFLIAAFSLSCRGLRRLFFIDVVAEMKQQPDLTVAHVLEVARQQPCVLVVSPDESFLDEVRKALTDQPEPLRVLSYDPSRLPELAIAGNAARQGGQHVVCLASRDPLRGAAAEHEEAILDVLAGCEVLTGSHLPNDDEEPSTAYVERLWARCTDSERQLLGRLVLDGLITPHPHLAPEVECLARRGILCPSTLTLRNPKLEELVRSKVSEEDVRKWADVGEGNGWDRLKAPLTATVAAICVALGSSEPELFAAGMTAPLVAASLPSILRLLVSSVGTSG